MTGARITENRLDNHAFTDPVGPNARANLNNDTTDIGALDARKLRQGPGPARIFCPGGSEAIVAAGPCGLGNGFRIPGGSRVYIGIVDPGGSDTDQNVAGAGNRHRDIVAIDKPVEPAVAGHQHGFHVSRRAAGQTG